MQNDDSKLRSVIQTGNPVQQSPNKFKFLVQLDRPFWPFRKLLEPKVRLSITDREFWNNPRINIFEQVGIGLID